MAWRNYRFGWWDAPSCEYATPVEPPVGDPCLECSEPIEDGDRGLVVPYVSGKSATWQPVHLECHLRGTMSHQYKQCHCYVPDRSVRDEARATLVAVNAQRAEQGTGPL